MALIYLGCMWSKSKITKFWSWKKLWKSTPHLAWSQCPDSVWWERLRDEWENFYLLYLLCLNQSKTNQTQNWKVQRWSSPGHPQCGMSCPACMMDGNPTVSRTHVMRSSLLTETCSHFCLPECFLRVDTSLNAGVHSQSLCLALPYRGP